MTGNVGLRGPRLTECFAAQGGEAPRHLTYNCRSVVKNSRLWCSAPGHPRSRLSRLVMSHLPGTHSVCLGAGPPTGALA